jgi:nitroreductase
VSHTQVTGFDTDQIDRLLTTTVSVRKRLDLDRPVEPAVITECLRLATFAPSASNTQKWRWLVVTDPDKRAQVAGLYRKVYEDAMANTSDQDPGASAMYDTEPAAQRILSSSIYLIENLHRVPALVIPCYLERPNPAGGNLSLSSMYGSVLQAVWSLQLALRSRGLGSAWTTMHLQNEREVAEALGIPDDVTQVALLPVAYTIGTDFKAPPRNPVEDVVFWNGWGERWS